MPYGSVVFKNEQAQPLNLPQRFPRNSLQVPIHPHRRAHHALLRMATTHRFGRSFELVGNVFNGHAHRNARPSDDRRLDANYGFSSHGQPIALRLYLP